MTEFELLSLLEYLVGTWLIGYKRFKLKESAMIIRLLLIEEWWGKEGSHKLRLQMFTLVFLRYFTAVCEESEYTFII